MTPAPFRVVMADPPWPFADKLPGKGRGAAKHYHLLAMEGICGFPLPPLADDCALLLWRVASMQQEALDVVKAWGFTLKTEIVWRKTTKTGKRHFGMGRTVRAEHETCLIAVRGKPVVKDRAVRSTFDAQVGVHSAKPVEIYEIAERLYDGPFLSVFDRRQRDGWTCIGDQADAAVPYAGAAQ